MKKFVGLIIVLSLVLAVCTLALWVVLKYIQPMVPDLMDLFVHEEPKEQKETDDDDSIDFESVEKYQDIVEEYATKYDVPITLVYAVIECESSFRENAKSSVGACGLMQLMPVTFNDVCEWLSLDYTVEQIMDPKVNIQCGTYYLSRMYRMFDDWELAVAAYNAGPGNVQKWLKNDDYVDDGKLVYIPFKETSNHVQKVVKAWDKYETQMKG